MGQVDGSGFDRTEQIIHGQEPARLGPGITGRVDIVHQGAGLVGHVSGQGFVGNHAAHGQGVIVLPGAAAIAQKERGQHARQIVGKSGVALAVDQVAQGAALAGGLAIQCLHGGVLIHASGLGKEQGRFRMQALEVRGLAFHGHVTDHDPLIAGIAGA